MFLQTALIIKIRSTINTHLINYNKLFTPLSSVKKSEILTDIRSPHQDHIDSDGFWSGFQIFPELLSEIRTEESAEGVLEPICQSPPGTPKHPKLNH